MAARILSVSYDEALLATREMLLARDGHRVVSALGYTEAKKRCHEGDYDVFVLGHSIPESDKRALISEFRNRCKGVVVSLLRAGERLVDTADYHIEPEPHLLLSLISDIMGRQQQPS